MPKRIYLDNAATSWPKPEAVYRAVETYMRQNGAPAGRSAYHHATESERLLSRTRAAAARLLGIAEPRRLVFAFNGTDALNMLIHGVLRPGDHVVSSVVEHNSVLRPLSHCAQHRDVRVSYANCDGQGCLDPEAIARAIEPATRLVVVTHASNVTGAIQPVEEIAAICREREALLLVDAAQTVGHLPVSVEQLGCDMLAASGHKGLLGPLGTGLAYIGPRAEPLLTSFRQGGTGTRSEDPRQPESLPDKFESGNPNMVGIAGLHAALEFLETTPPAEIHQLEMALTESLLTGLAEIPGVQIAGPTGRSGRVGVVSVTTRGLDPQEAATLLDATAGIQVRSGLHCAPRIHENLGTIDSGGTLRLSVGAFNTQDHIGTAVKALEELTAAVS